MWQSTLAECTGGTLSPSRFGVWTSIVLPIKDFTMNMRGWWHGGSTPPRETAQSRSKPKHVASHFIQWTSVKKIPIGKGPSLHGSWVLARILQKHCCFCNIIRFDRFDFIQFPPQEMYFHYKFYHCKIIDIEKKFPSASWDDHIPLYGRCVVYWLSHWLNWYHGRT